MRVVRPYTLFGIIFLEGFVTVSAEILVLRQLLPVVGNNVVVTSLVIGFFLLFLALGYKRGGQYIQDGDKFLQRLQRNFVFSAYLLGVGLSYAFILIFFSLIKEYWQQTHNLVILLGYLLIITAPLVYFLGQTVPISMNLFKSSNSVGAIGGSVLYLSTLGSFLGAILTTLLLMNFFGVAVTVFINFIILVILSIIVYTKQRRSWQFILLSVLGCVIVYQLNIGYENKYFVLTNNHANYQIMDIANEPSLPKGKLLLVNNSASSFLSGSDNLGFDYIEVIKKIIFKDLNVFQKNILVLGAGGFSLSAQGEYNNHITYVDIDKDIKQVVEKNYLNNINGKFIAEDARVFLKDTSNKYFVIISDVYNSQNAIPMHLLTREYFSLVAARLQKNGIAIFNIIAKPMATDSYSQNIDKTLRSVFTTCMSIPVDYVDSWSNIIYVCRDNSDSQTAVVYTDNLNQASLDYTIRGK
jgi:predicted membrane-bound spermidine synthase